jgi:magnesium-transporting ATPase (P-type)
LFDKTGTLTQDVFDLNCVLLVRKKGDENVFGKNISEVGEFEALLEALEKTLG